MAEIGASANINVAQALQLISAQIEATPKQLALAADRALKKTCKWATFHMTRELSQVTGIVGKALKLRFSMKKVGTSYILWVGTKPIVAELAGSARMNARGVRVRSHQFDSAFIASMYGQDNAVWIRAKKNREYGYQTTALKRKPNPNRLPAHLQGRFPVQHLAISIADEAAELMKRFEPRIEAEFQKKLKQELNYAANVEGE